jgi:lactoylglutathione lyase
MNKLIYRFDHLHLITPDIEKTKNWYCNVLNSTVAAKLELKGKVVYYIDLGGVSLILIEGGLPEEIPLPATIQTREGLDHFGLEVRDLEESLKDLSSKGVDIYQPITVIREGLRVAYITGPDDVRIELVERKLI